MSIKAKADRALYETAMSRGMEFIFAERIDRRVGAFREARGAQAEYQAEVGADGCSYHCQVVPCEDHYQIWVGPQTRVRVVRALPGETIERTTKALRQKTSTLTRPRKRAKAKKG